jgi:hypothetical protein
MRLMIPLRGVFILILFIISPAALLADSQNEFHQKVAALYNFSPCTLDEEQKRAKGPQLDAFWNYVKENPKLRLPFLREELRTMKSNGFFLYDGSSLLMKLSKERSDLDLAVQSLARVDLCGIDLSDYFIKTYLLAIQGIDVWPMMKRIAERPDFHVYLPDYKLTLSQDYALLFLSLLVDDAFWLDGMIAKLDTEKNSRSSRALVTAIAFSVTKKGQQAIERCSKENPDEKVRAYAKVFLKLESRDALPDPGKITIDKNNFTAYLNSLEKRSSASLSFNPEQFAKEIPYLITRSDYDQIKRTRRKVAERLAEDTLDDLFYLTALLQFAYTSKE